jgi:hypothetical protein
MRLNQHLTDVYRFPGFRPLATIRGIFGDPKARVVRLSRRGKKQNAGPAAKLIDHFTTTRYVEFEIYPAATAEYIWNSKFDGYSVGVAER